MTNRVEPAFAQFLRDGGIPEDKIEEFVGIAERFEAFLAVPGEAGSRRPPTAEEVNTFSATLVQEELNTWDNYVALARYGRFLNSNEVYIAVVELIDGAEALDSLYEKLGSSLGEEQRDEIFAGIKLPPLGTPSSQKPEITQVVMERLERMVDPKTCQTILSGGLRYLEDAWFQEGRKTYLECSNLDEYLERKGREFIAQLEKLKSEGKLFFTQEITDEVIEFVDSHPEIRQGVRVGNILYEAKIPYMTREYLAATDDKMKRYYYCHCPWVRESLKEGDVNVSATFCHCSAGFHKKGWEVALDRSLEAEMVESVLQGDAWCKFAIYLPEDLVPE